MKLKEINSYELKQLVEIKQRDLEIIDVRDRDEYEIIKFKYSKLIPMNEIRDRMNEIDWSKMVVFICRSGARSRYVAERVINAKWRPINLQGGIIDFYYNFDSENFLEINEERVNEYL